MCMDDIKKEALTEENTEAVEVETDEDGAFVAMISDEDVSEDFPDEDGCAAAVRIDTTGDGYSETIFVDEDGDGEPDVILKDTDGDGNFDTTIIISEEDDK